MLRQTRCHLAGGWWHPPQWLMWWLKWWVLLKEKREKKTQLVQLDISSSSSSSSLLLLLLLWMPPLSLRRHFSAEQRLQREVRLPRVDEAVVVLREAFPERATEAGGAHGLEEQEERGGDGVGQGKE